MESDHGNAVDAVQDVESDHGNAVDAVQDVESDHGNAVDAVQDVESDHGNAVDAVPDVESDHGDESDAIPPMEPNSLERLLLHILILIFQYAICNSILSRQSYNPSNHNKALMHKHHSSAIILEQPQVVSKISKR